MKLIVCASVVAVHSLVAAGPASAADATPILSDAFTTCMDASGGVTMEMNACTSAETELQDALLNQRYKQLMAALEPAGKEALKNAQRRWIAYRDAECELAYQAAGGDEGGTMAPMVAGGCVMDQTARRAAELAVYLEQVQM